jgi:hypothetical protein
MPNRNRIFQIASFVLAFILSACGANKSTPVVSTIPVVANAEGGGEGGGAEAALVTYTDVAQGFSIGYPQPWTRDPSVTSGVKFVGGDDYMTLEFVTPPSGTDAMTYAQSDAANLSKTFKGYKQVGLAASAEVKNAIVLGFEASGKSTITGKDYTARGDRYYMPLADGRIAVLTELGPSNHYDSQGVRDIALTFKLTH